MKAGKLTELAELEEGITVTKRNVGEVIGLPKWCRERIEADEYDSVFYFSVVDGCKNFLQVSKRRPRKESV